MAKRIPTILQGMPDDLMTTDHPYARALKVSMENIAEIQSSLLVTLSDLIQSNVDIEKQLKLLNVRVEEAFETHIQEIDIDG